MSRVKLTMPSEIHGEAMYTISVSDLNYGNHLGNDKVLSIMHNARIILFKKYGYTELEFGEASVIQGDAAIVYKSEGHLHDELRIEMAVADVSNSSFDVYYSIFNLSTSKILAIGKTRIICFDYEAGRTVKCPTKWTELFGN